MSLWTEKKYLTNFLPHELRHFSFRMTTKMSLTIFFYMNEVTSHCSLWSPVRPDRGSGWKSGMGHSALGKLAEQALRYLDHFWRKFYEANFLQCIHRKVLNSFIETSVILTLSHLLPRCEVSSCNPFTAITYTDLPWPPWSSSWELIDAVLLAITCS